MIDYFTGGRENGDFTDKNATGGIRTAKHGVPDTHDVIAEINEVEQTNEQIGLQKETTESIAESVDEIAEGEKRSIFAAPKWDPAKPGECLTCANQSSYRSDYYSNEMKGL